MKQSLVYPQCVENIYKSNSPLDKTIKKNSPSNENLVKNFELKNKKSTIEEISVPDINRIASLTDKYLAPPQKKIAEDQIYEW